MPARHPRRTASASYRPALTPPAPPSVPAAPTDTNDRGDDGIRWELVDRMRALIAADELDTPDRWALAEELLLGEVVARTEVPN